MPFTSGWAMPWNAAVSSSTGCRIGEAGGGKGQSVLAERADGG
jgi:hypothetical protein